jgi:hypothetical protein
VPSLSRQVEFTPEISGLPTGFILKAASNDFAFSGFKGRGTILKYFAETLPSGSRLFDSSDEILFEGAVVPELGSATKIPAKVKIQIVFSTQVSMDN